MLVGISLRRIGLPAWQCSILKRIIQFLPRPRITVRSPVVVCFWRSFGKSSRNPACPRPHLSGNSRSFPKKKSSVSPGTPTESSLGIDLVVPPEIPVGVPLRVPPEIPLKFFQEFKSFHILEVLYQILEVSSKNSPRSSSGNSSRMMGLVV